MRPETRRREPEAQEARGLQGTGDEREERHEQHEVEVQVRRRKPRPRRGRRKVGSVDADFAALRRERRDGGALEGPDQEARRGGDRLLVGRREGEPEARARPRTRRPCAPRRGRRAGARVPAGGSAAFGRPMRSDGRGGLRPLLARRPEEEEEHAEEHDRGLPQDRVGGGEERRPVRADPEERHDAHEVQQLDRGEADDEPEERAAARARGRRGRPSRRAARPRRRCSRSRC